MYQNCIAFVVDGSDINTDGEDVYASDICHLNIIEIHKISCDEEEEKVVESDPTLMIGECVSE